MTWFLRPDISTCFYLKSILGTKAEGFYKTSRFLLFIKLTFIIRTDSWYDMLV